MKTAAAAKKPSVKLKARKAKLNHRYRDKVESYAKHEERNNNQRNRRSHETRRRLSRETPRQIACQRHAVEKEVPLPAGPYKTNGNTTVT